MVSFGTTYEETRRKTIDRLEQEIQEAYPQVTCYRAFSSGIVRKILKERDGMYVMDPEEALLKMKEDGIRHVKIIPTHIIAGLEYQKICNTAKKWKSLFEEIQIGSVLLETEEDYETVAEVLWKELSDQAEGKILLLMGHGSEHKANASYGKLEGVFRQRSGADVFVATVEGAPELSDAMAQMKFLDRRSVFMTPFMLVAGDHAVNDMAGEEDSWKTELEEAGYETAVLVKGLGEYAGIRALYQKHLKKIMSESEESF